MNVAAHKQAGPAAAGAAPLVVRCGAFGDIVMLTTLIRLLHARYGRRIDVLGAGPWTHALLEPLPEVGTVWTVRSRNTPYLLCPSQWATVAWLRRRGRGPVYVCDTDAPTLRLLQRARLKEEDRVQRVREDDEHDGVPRLWPDRWVRLGQRDPVHRYPCAGDVVAETFRLPRLVVAPADRADVLQWKSAHGIGSAPCILFQPGNKRTHKRGRLGAGSNAKHWPATAWAELAQAIWNDLPDARIVLCGSPAEHGVLDDIHAATQRSPRMLNAARELPVPRLLALMEHAHSMVSVDTGPAHAAAALACPLVVMFGAASPAKWRPIGPGAIRVLGGERGSAGRVADLEVADVVHAWRALPVRDQPVLSMP